MKPWKHRKEIEEDSRRQKDFLCSWLDRINVVTMALLTWSQVQCNLHQNSHFKFLIEVHNLHIHKKKQTKQVAKAILNKNNARDIAIFDFKLYYRT